MLFSRVEGHKTMQTLSYLRGTAALLIILVLGAIGTYVTHGMVRKAAWIGVIVVAVLAAYNEWND